MPAQTLGALAPNPKNPRTITDEKLKMLEKSLKEFGDLSGIIYNRKTKQLVGGHQRSKVLAGKPTIKITKEYSKPTASGTVAEGYIQTGSERFSYREVEWSETKEKAANIAANKGAGEWDLSNLSNWMRELSETKFDLDLTMFDESERLSLLSNSDFQPGSEDEQPKLDEKKPLIVECPKCGECFDGFKNTPAY